MWSIQIHELLQHFRGIQIANRESQNNQFQVLCPAHDDQSPSLSVGLTEGGKILLHCFKGCTPENIVRAVGLSIRDLFNDSSSKQIPRSEDNGKSSSVPVLEKEDRITVVRKEKVQEYEYQDEYGKLLYVKERWKVIYSNGKTSKTFTFKQPVSEGEKDWKYSLAGIKRTLYNLQERKRLKNQIPVPPTIIVEGEKCADLLQWLVGDSAWVTTSGSADSWRDEYALLLKGDEDIILVPDNDEPGQRYLDSIERSLRELTGKREIVRMDPLPGSIERGDVADWIERGGSAEAFWSLVDLNTNILTTIHPQNGKTHDFFSLYEEYVSEATDSPRIFHKFMAFQLASIVMRHHVFYSHGIQKLFPNLWTLYVAPSSFFHKSTVLSSGLDLLREFNPELLMPSEFSHEGLVKAMSKRPQGLMVVYEFAKFYSLLNREYMQGTTAFLSEIYDCPQNYDRMLSENTIKIEYPFLSIAAASTVDWMESLVEKKDLFGGFFARFILVPAHTKDKILPLPPTPDHAKRQILLNEMARITRIYGEITISPEASDYYKNWYVQYEEKYRKRELWSPFYVRLMTTCLKFATILQVVRYDYLQVKLPVMEEACHITESITRSMNEFLESEIALSPADEKNKKIIRILKQSKGHAEWSQVLKNSHMQARDFREVMETLVQQGALRIEEKGSKKFISRV